MIHHSLCNDGRNQREKEDRVWKKLFLWSREPSSSSPISAPTSNPITKFQIEISKTLRKQSFEISFLSTNLRHKEEGRSVETEPPDVFVAQDEIWGRNKSCRDVRWWRRKDWEAMKGKWGRGEERMPRIKDFSFLIFN